MRAESVRVERYDVCVHSDRDSVPGVMTMPGTVRPIADERDGLLAYLAQQRLGLRAAVHGLTDEQARMTPSKSSLSLGGLIKHAAICERGWVAGIIAQRLPKDGSDRDWGTE